MSPAAVAADAETGFTPRPKSTYYPWLDVLRGLAILMVLVCHGLDPANGTVFDQYHSIGMFALRTLTADGRFGVHLFFILSGFLITGILLQSRADRDYYRNFYLRRVLRIVPAYVLMLIALKLGGVVSWRFLLICVLYLCNMPGLLGGRPEYGPLWSLSVEEQFYLVWPLVVRKLSLRALAWFSAAIVVLTPLLRFVLLYGPAPLHDIDKKTWAVCDFFAAGALIAIAVRTPRLYTLLRRAAVPLTLLGLGLSLLLFLPLEPAPATQNAVAALGLEPVLITFSGLVLLAALLRGKPKALVFRPLLFLARISYGLYLCHEWIFVLVSRHWPFPPIPGAGPVAQLAPPFAVGSALSIAVAFISRNTVEERFLQLKPRHQRPPRAVADAPNLT